MMRCGGGGRLASFTTVPPPTPVEPPLTPSRAPPPPHEAPSAAETRTAAHRSARARRNFSEARIIFRIAHPLKAGLGARLPPAPERAVTTAALATRAPPQVVKL